MIGPQAPIDWPAIGAMATAVSAAITGATVLVLRYQLLAIRKAMHAQGFLGAASILQEQSVRDARERVFALKDRDWSLWNGNEINDVKRISQAYDVVGIMARNGIFPVELVADSWGDSLRRLWEICSPFIVALRDKQRAPEYWNDFEWLALQARNVRRRTVHGKRSKVTPL